MSSRASRSTPSLRLRGSSDPQPVQTPPVAPGQRILLPGESLSKYGGRRPSPRPGSRKLKRQPTQSKSKYHACQAFDADRDADSSGMAAPCCRESPFRGIAGSVKAETDALQAGG